MWIKYIVYVDLWTKRMHSLKSNGIHVTKAIACTINYNSAYFCVKKKESWRYTCMIYSMYHYIRMWVLIIIPQTVSVAFIRWLSMVLLMVISGVWTQKTKVSTIRSTQKTKVSTMRSKGFVYEAKWLHWLLQPPPPIKSTKHTDQLGKAEDTQHLPSLLPCPS